MDKQELCAVCAKMTFNDLLTEAGFKHHPVSKFVDAARSSVGPCQFCALIWWSLRYDHEWLEEDGSTYDVWLWKPRKRDNVIDVIAATDRHRDQFRSHVDGDLDIYDSMRVAIGELSLYSVRGE